MTAETRNARVDVRGLVDVVSDLRHSAVVDDYEIDQIAFINSIADRIESALAAEGVQAEPKAEAQLTYKGVPIGPMQTFADIERQATVLADPRAATEQAIAEALRRERMAPDDYAPMPDAPVPFGNDD